MISQIYTQEGIEMECFDANQQAIDFKNWLLYVDSVSEFNTLNDLLVNGQVDLIDQNKIFLPYEELSKLDSFEYHSLNLPPSYPFDIFIDIIGTGLKDINLIVKYSFQDFAHRNGTGNILNFQRKGAYLEGISEYLLSLDQFFLIKEIDQMNRTAFKDPNQVLQAVGEIQKRATQANAVMSRILIDTKVVTSDNVKIDIEKVDENKFRLRPVIESTNSKKFQEKFDLFPNVKPEYHYKDEQQKVHVVFKDDGAPNNLKSELKKLKSKSTFNQDDLVEMYNNPTKYWDAEVIDIEYFGKRVLELGIYKPKFYPFISPYKSQWIPGIAVEDRVSGTRLVNIKNEEELDELREEIARAKAINNQSIVFKGEELDVSSIDPFISLVEQQLRNPSVPISQKSEHQPQNEYQQKVLIIKENMELLEYSESIKPEDIDEFHFQPINNLSTSIQLKAHQEQGIAWLQTLYLPPYSNPGVLLADDMGLGKTIQVLYFIEWYIQTQKEKPILIVAPVSLLENWQNEYKKFFPNPSLESITLWGSQIKEQIITGNKEATVNHLSKKCIYLTTYETLRKQQISLGMIDWGIVILDEAQKIKTPGTFVTNAAKALKSEFKIAMTGTPVENTLMDLWCIIDFCSPGLLENARSFFNKYQKSLKIDGVDYEDISIRLRNEIGVILLRRMKADVAKDLPSIDYFRFKEEMPPKQYNAYLSEVNQIRENSKNGNGILQGILNLRSLSDHPYLKHYQIENIPTDELIASSAKMRKMVALLTTIRDKREKVIVFTENKAMQRVIRKVIKDIFSFNSAIINGETPSSQKTKSKLSRQQEIDRFQEKNGFGIIIMSPVAAGFGLNITEANHIIHYSRHWNPAKEQQATDRAYRIGQKKPVQVYYPMAVAPDNEFETFDIVIDNLLARKSHLAKSTLFPTDQIEIAQDDFMKSIGFELPKAKDIVINTMASIDILQPLIFEAVIALLIEKIHGGKSYLTSRSNDKGVDIIHFNENGNLLIQVKQSSGTQGINSGQEIKYALSKFTDRFQKSFRLQAITNNYFTPSAKEMAKYNHVELIDRDTIKTWLSEHSVLTSEIDEKMKDRV